MAGNNISRKWVAEAAIDARGMQTGASQAVQSAKGMEQALEGVFGRMGAALKFPGISIGMESITSALSIQGVRSFMGQFGESATAAENLGFLNDQLGTSVEWLSSLQTAAGEAGIDANQFSSSIGRLQQTLGQAALGSAEAQGTFGRLGLTWQVLRNQSFEKTFSDVAGALAGVSDRSERARLAVELFGREGGQRMLRLFQDGAAGVSRSIAEVQARGGFITEAGLARMQAADAAMDAAATRWAASWRDFNVSIAPAVTSSVNFLSSRLDEVATGWRLIIREFSAPPVPSAPPRPAMTGGPGGTIVPATPSAQLAFATARHQAATTELTGLQAQRDALPEGASTAELDRAIQRVIEFRNATAAAVLEARGLVAAGQQPVAAFGPAIMGIQAWDQEAAAANVNTNNSVSDATNALMRQNEVFGMNANEVQRLRFVQAGASEQALRDFDAQIARQEQLTQGMRDRAQAEQQMAGIRRMVEQARSPWEAMQARLQQFDQSGLNPEQRGRLISQALPQVQPAPLLGSLRADSSEVGAILQASMNPQIDAAQAQLAVLEAMRDDARESQERMRELARDTREILRLANGG